MIDERLLELVGSLAGRAPDRVLQQAEREIGYGEYGLAVENLCECLYDAGTPITTADFVAFQAVAGDLGLLPERWRFIEKLVSRG